MLRVVSSKKRFQAALVPSRSCPTAAEFRKLLKQVNFEVILIYMTLKASFASGLVINIKYHKNWTSSYTFAHNLASLAQKRKTTNSTKPSPKKLRSETKGLKFDLKNIVCFVLG